MITEHGKLSQYNSNVLLPIVFETIKDAQNIPTSIAYKSVFVKSVFLNIYKPQFLTTTIYNEFCYMSLKTPYLNISAFNIVLLEKFIPNKIQIYNYG